MKEMRKIVPVQTRNVYKIDATLDPIENLCVCWVNVANELHEIKEILKARM